LRERWRLVQIEVDRILLDTKTEYPAGQRAEHQVGLIVGISHRAEFPGKQDVQTMQEQFEPRKAQRDRAVLELENFLKELREIKILDPACGTGNFLYVTMDLMKELESEVLARLAEVSGRDQLRLDFEQINPSQFLGIEINPRAAAIADLVVWIGYLQWHFRRFGDVPPIEPVLRAYHNIENRDAVLAYDGVEPDIDPKTGKVRTRWGGRTMIHPVTGKAVPDPSDQKVIYRYLNPRPAEWPAADYIISNPPFIGTKRMKDFLGEGYTSTLRNVIKEVPDSSDFVIYWWHKSANLVQQKKVLRFGLISTNSITQSFNRKTVEQYLKSENPISIDFAIPDHPWIDSSDGANVRIAMVVASAGDHIGNLFIVFSEENLLDGYFKVELIKSTGKIHANLSAGAATSQVKVLQSNANISGMGVALHGSGFKLDPETASHYRKYGSNVIRPYVGGRDLLHAAKEGYVIDFSGLSENEARQSNPVAFQHVIDHVKPERDQNRRESIRRLWWRFGWERPLLRMALVGLPRYITTVETAKYRIFQFVPEEYLPDHKNVVIALSDSYYLGIFSSTSHVTWAIAAGGKLEDRPVYSKTTCFDPFPFPDPDDRLKQEIRELGDRLDAHRKTVQANHPDITITGMYNLLEKIRNRQPLTDKDREFNQRALVSTLKQIHDDLDRAVFHAYGWDDLIPQWERAHGGAPLPEEPTNSLDEQILERLVKLNADRAEEERNGHIRWLRPDYQAPGQTTPTGQQTDLPIEIESTEPATASSKPIALPKGFKERVAAVRDLFRAEGGEWTIDRAASRFSGKTTKTKRQQIAQAIEALEGAGLLLSYEDKGDRHWYDASLQAIA